jgi:hypothetical protein
MCVMILILRSKRHQLLQFPDGRHLGSGEILEIKPWWTMGKLAKEANAPKLSIAI